MTQTDIEKIKELPLGFAIKLKGDKAFKFVPKSIYEIQNNISKQSLRLINNLAKKIERFCEKEEVLSVVEKQPIEYYLNFLTKAEDKKTELFKTYYESKNTTANIRQNSDILKNLEDIFAENKSKGALKRDNNIVVFYPQAQNAGVWRGPPIQFVDPLMKKLKLFLQADLKSGESWFLKALVCQLQLLAIHAYKDHNGRIGRSLVCLLAPNKTIFKILTLLTYNCCKNVEFYKYLYAATNVKNLNNYNINDYLRDVIKLITSQLKIVNLTNTIPPTTRRLGNRNFRNKN